MPVLRFQI